MLSKIVLNLLTVMCLLKISSVRGQRGMKSSLTFVIDSTGSMWNEINAVKAGANSIFDTVMNSAASQIEDFILVTFNDPEVNLLTVTKDRNEFKRKLASIDISGGNDCPEMSMGGIEKALEASRPGSYLYVFTDASAKDDSKYENVKNLAVDKGCQVTFVLSGECSDGNTEVYYTLAEATRTEVFNLEKGNFGVILNYVKENIKARKAIVSKTTFPPGSHKFNYTVDGNMKELIVSVTGTNPRVYVTDPVGNAAETEDLVRTPRIAIVKVLEAMPGMYTAEVKSETKTSVIVSGTNTIHFEQGFSELIPLAFEETTSQPLPDEKAYVSVKVNAEGGAVQVQSIQILDLDYNLITERILFPSNDNTFYVSSEPFVPPNKSFRVAIKGYDEDSKSLITRYGLTPIEPQGRKKVEINNKAPIVTIIGKPEVNVDYEVQLELRCRVSGYPKPDITWENEERIILPSTVKQIEIPYDYVTILKLDNVIQNDTYKCKAGNEFGETNKQIEVKTKRTKYFDVLEIPEDKVIKYGTEGQFVCKVDAAPEPAIITWTKEIKNNKHRYRKIREDETNYQISSGGSVLTIKHMKPTLDGKYKCIAKNNRVKKGFKFEVSTSGVATGRSEQQSSSEKKPKKLKVAPKVDKTNNEITVREGSNAVITCKLARGTPQPMIRWSFGPKNSIKFEPITYTNETIIIKNADRNHAGTYRCNARNPAGEDIHHYDLIVEYPPSISGPVKIIREIPGNILHIPCNVSGVPPPDVAWFKNGSEVEKSGHYHFHNDHSISFKATLDDVGSYACIAKNKYGITEMVPTEVHVIVPVSIEPPKQSLFEVPVSGNVTLECVADGSPEPTVRWFFRGVNTIVSTKPMKSLDATNSLILSRIQVNDEGYYTCIASNVGSLANITYEVNVIAPPTITSAPERKYVAVVEDLALRVPCKTIGSPKPTITWMKSGFHIASGTPWYDIESDGSLLIKNVEKVCEGSYMCTATNRLGVDMKSFDVYVEEYPKPGRATNKTVIEEGKSSPVSCNVPHRRVDLLRWYKDGEKISSGELTLKKVKTNDSGIYTCRVSTLAKSVTGNTLVDVGFKPKFSYDENTHIEFEDGLSAVLSCFATANPPPEVSWWYNGQQLEVTSMTYTFNMTIELLGHYHCLLTNQYGYIIRKFEISTKECALNIETNFGENWPNILSNDLKWPSFVTLKGFMRIPQNRSITLSCPDEFENFDSHEIVATCIEENNFTVEGNIHDYSDFKCKEDIEPIIIQTDELCQSDNKESELIKIGFEVRDDILEVLEVCLDKTKKIPIYAKHSMPQTFADFDPKKTQWFDSDFLPFEFNELYDCESQKDLISTVLRTSFHDDDKCCFFKRQLVNPRDVLPGLSQLATYSHLNVAPQWSSCNMKNWELMENRVRKLAKSRNRQLVVWTGIARSLQINRNYIKISDEDEQSQEVPLYIWKVVQDQVTQSSIAIIQVNVPDLEQAKAHRFLRCRDICSEVEWMKSTNWRDVKRGFTYCCSIKEFEKRFSFEGLFGDGFDKVLV